MQEFTTFDIVVLAITLLIGLKGLFRGFIKEAFGLIGIVGGLFVASRFAEVVGKEVAPLIGVTNESTTVLFGFIATLVGFWIAVYFIGMVITKVTEMSGLGIFNRVAGFIFGGAKIFLIFSVVAYLAMQVNAFKSILNSKDTIKNSTVFPLLVETGSFVFKLDTSKFLTQEEEKKEASKPQNEEVQTSQTNQENSTFTQEVKKELEATTQNVKEAVSETSNEVKEAVANEAKKALEQTITEKLNTQEEK